jgi:putative endonuclease
MPYHTYVLISEEGLHYTGSTGDLETRLKRHQAKTTHFTKTGTSWRVIYSKEFSTRSEAVKHEKWLKSGVGREWLKKNIAGWSPPQAE